MSIATKRCQLPGCNRAASASCHCCDQTICTRHFIEHIEAVRVQVDPLANEVNTMVENIQQFSVAQLKETALVKLQQWQKKMYNEIDGIVKRKSLEITNLCQENKEEFQNFHEQQLSTVKKIQDEIRRLIKDDDATKDQIQSLKSQLHLLEGEINGFKRDFLIIDDAYPIGVRLQVSSKIQQKRKKLGHKMWGIPTVNVQSARHQTNSLNIPQNPVKEDFITHVHANSMSLSSQSSHATLLNGIRGFRRDVP